MPLLELALRGAKREQAGAAKRTRLPITPRVLSRLRGFGPRHSYDVGSVLCWVLQVWGVGRLGFRRL